MVIVVGCELAGLVAVVAVVVAAVSSSRQSMFLLSNYARDADSVLL